MTEAFTSVSSTSPASERVMKTAVGVTFELADFLDPGQRVDLHEGVGDADDMHHVHDTLTDREAGRRFNDTTTERNQSTTCFSTEACLTVWTACHSPTSFLKSNTFTMVSAAGHQTQRN